MSLSFQYPLLEWNFFKKFILRFGFGFVILFILPFPFDLLAPLTNWPSEVLDNLFKSLVPWVGQHVLGIAEPIDVTFNGSGDKTMNYVGLFIQFSLALFIAVVWSIADRNRRSYNQLFYWLMVLCRYYLAFTLFGYGFAKVFKLQMSALGLNQLVQPIGEQSPMGMAWNFIGFSDLYCRFSGWAEVVSGALLVFNRTRVLGGILSFVVMTYVMLLNFAFDIPVKIYSSFLVLLSLILLSPYYKRLFGVLFSNRFVNTLDETPVFKKQWQHRLAFLLKYGLVIYVCGINFYQNYQQQFLYGELAPQPPLYGIYETQTCFKNRDSIYPFADTSTWKRMVFNKTGFTNVLKYNDKKLRLTCEIDSVKQQIQFKDRSDSTLQYLLNYKRLNDSMYRFSGIFNKDTFSWTSLRKTRNDFLIYKRGFNWINEAPFNR